MNYWFLRVWGLATIVCSYGPASLAKKRLTERIKLNYRKANLDKIKSTLSSSDWDRLLEGKIETAWNNFKNLILSLVDANVPKMKVSGTKSVNQFS